MKTLKDRIDWVLSKKGWSRSAWATEAGMTRVHVGKLLERESTNEGRVELEVIRKLAAAAGVSAGWLAYGIGSPSDDERWMVTDPSAADFLYAIGAHAGLREWLPQAKPPLRVSDVERAMRVLSEEPSLSRADGQPKEGWEAFFEDLREGNIGRPTEASGDAAAASAAERQQVPDLPPTTVPDDKPTRRKRHPR